MTTSSTYTWTLNRDQAILMAFQEINKYGPDDTINSISSGEQTIAQNKLNGLLKMWSVDDIKVTKRLRGYLFPVINQNNYLLGSISGSADCTLNYNATTIAANAAGGTNQFTVGSTAGMTMGDNIGIELDSGSRQWTTIASVIDSATLQISANLTSQSSATNTVVSYTSKINRPLDILYGTVLDLKSQNNEVSLEMISHDEYWNMPIKTTSGRPNNAYYNKPLNGSIPHNSSLYLYPQPYNVWQIITFVYIDSIQDLASASDDIDLPQEWLYPVVYNLACELARFYGKFEELKTLQPIADKMYEIVKKSSNDMEDIQFKLGN